MEGDTRQSWFVQWMVGVVIVFIVYIDGEFGTVWTIFE